MNYEALGCIIVYNLALNLFADEAHVENLSILKFSAIYTRSKLEELIMVTMLNTGAYVLNGTEIIADDKDVAAVLSSKLGKAPSKEEAKSGTIAYGILKDHNVSGNMEKLQIKFDKLTSHDITFVGIIQTARASGMEKFPVPYVLTNCHNSLCAVGGTINEDDHMFG